MTNKILYWVTVVSAGIAFVLLIFNLATINSNQNIQQEIGFRQNVINTAVTVSPVNQQLAQALYDAAVKKDDKQIKDLLTEQGFTITEKPAKAEAEKTPAKAPAKKNVED